MRSASYQLEHTDELDNCVIEFEIGYSYSPEVPATYIDPPEGGLSLDYITCKNITWHDDDGKAIDRKPTKQELAYEEEHFSEYDAMVLASEDYASRMERD